MKDPEVRASFEFDLYTFSAASSPGVIRVLRPMLLRKWRQRHELLKDTSPSDASVLANCLHHLFTYWLSDRLSKWQTGSVQGLITNNQGLESTNKSIKKEVTDHHLVPTIELLNDLAVWLHNESCLRSESDSNYIPYALVRTMTRTMGELAYKLVSTKSWFVEGETDPYITGTNAILYIGIDRLIEANFVLIICL